MMKTSNVLKIIGKFLIITFSILYLFINKDKIIEKVPIKYLVVKSNSMSPTLYVDDIIIIKRVKQYRVGDIITYNYNNEYLITHRIIEKKNNEFITKGDYNNSPDNESINIESVKGKVIFVINKEKVYIFILIVCIFIAISIIWKGLQNEKSN